LTEPLQPVTTSHKESQSSICPQRAMNRAVTRSNKVAQAPSGAQVQQPPAITKVFCAPTGCKSSSHMQSQRATASQRGASRAVTSSHKGLHVPSAVHVEQSQADTKVYGAPAGCKSSRHKQSQRTTASQRGASRAVTSSHKGLRRPSGVQVEQSQAVTKACAGCKSSSHKQHFEQSAITKA
jgi:hypothetical protein